MADMREGLIERAAETLARARRVVVLTGAGVSAESGIPTFRDRTEGIWAKYDPTKLATPEAFAADPVTVQKWYDWRRGIVAGCVPNPGHHAIRELEELMRARGGSFTLLTQNVDRLHHRAGSARVIELHGTIWEWRCVVCRREVTVGARPNAEYPARCAKEGCRGLMRPCVVWFGEALPAEAMHMAEEALGACDVFLSVGTSAVVWPAAGFAATAKAHGAATIEVNRDPTPITGIVDHSIAGLSGEVLPAIVQRLKPAGR